MPELDEREYPLGSQKRQEKERELENLPDELNLAPSALVEENGPGTPQSVPEEMWRANG